MIYCYTREDNGEVEEVSMSLSELERRQQDGRIKLADGTWGTRNYAAEHAGEPKGDPWHWHVSEALACHPDQIKEQMAADKAAGVSTQGYTQDGSPIFSSAAQKRKYMRAYGFHDKNSFF